MLKATIFIILSILCNTLKSQDISKAFDFWLGDWEVTWVGPDSNIIVGENLIEKTLDGKVIQENFRDPSRNFKGTSLSVYNPQNNTWHQAWADNQGGYYDFLGVVEGEKRIFQTMLPDSNNQIFRMRFLDIREDSLVWKWEGKKVESKEWNLLWQINYKRKS